MSSLHPPTLLLANLLVALTLVLIVMSTRVGLGAGARGMRTWLLGDVLLLVGQASTAVDALPRWTDLSLPPLTLSSGFISAGVGLHLLGIHRHRQPPGTPGAWWLLSAPLMGLAVGVTSWLLDNPAHRAMLFNTVMTTILVLTVVRNLVPERRFLGVRVMMAAQAFAIFVNVMMFLGAATRPDKVLDGAMTGLLVNMVMTMMTTSAFVLWLQEELRETLQHTARTDPLTGVLNRHGVLPELRRELARAGRQGPPLSVALCDIDHFKRVNDVHGHAAGDTVLREFARHLQEHARATDLVARWGGEEFLLVLPGIDANGAKRVLERLRVRSAGDVSVTFSAGVASTSGWDGPTDVDTLLAHADARLYAAKATRDTVIAA